MTEGLLGAIAGGLSLLFLGLILLVLLYMLVLDPLNRGLRWLP